MIVTRERRVAGAISGGCLEGDVLRRGFWRTEGGPAVVTYDASEDGVGSGCNGVSDVLLERVLPGETRRVDLKLTGDRYWQHSASLGVAIGDERATVHFSSLVFP